MPNFGRASLTRWIVGLIVFSIAFVAAAQQQDKPQAAALIDAARHAFVDGWAASIWVGTTITSVLFVFLAFRAPRLPRSTERADAPLCAQIPDEAALGATTGARS